MSERQLQILRHAVGWPKNYRNHFLTWPGTKDYADCEALVSAGLMALARADEIGGGTYKVTDEGWKAMRDAT